jgi:hypothetical protein
LLGGRFEGTERFVPEPVEPPVQGLDTALIDLVKAPRAFSSDRDKPCRLENLKMLGNG